MSFFAEIFMILMTFCIICLVLAIVIRVIEIIWLCIYPCFSSFMCPNRPREHWIAEFCGLLILLIICIDNTLYKCCCSWCGQISRKLRRCKTKLKLCKICVNKKLDKIRVKPIVYDDVHIIVVNPFDNYQIATVSSSVNDT